MKQALIIILAVYCTFNVSAANLSGGYGGAQCPKFYIGLYHHGQYQCIDSVMVDTEGEFSTTLPDNRKGILLIACHNDKSAMEALNKADNTSSLQFVYDGQDITYKTSWRWHNSDDYLKVSEGGETTRLTGMYVKKRQELYERLASLEAVLDKTDPGSPFFTVVDTEYTETIEKYNRELCNAMSSAALGSMFETILMCLLEPEVPSGLQGEQRVDWLREHLFDHVDLSNPLVYDCPFFMNRLHQYLYIWQPKGMASENEIRQMKSQGIELLKEKVKVYPESIQKALQKCLEVIEN